MLPLILNSRVHEWLISPDYHQKWGEQPSLFVCAYAWVSFHFELWEEQSVSEVFAGVQGAGPLAGVVRGQCPLA